MTTAVKPKKVLVIGSGPIVIGQAAEFDYAGTPQALSSVSPTRGRHSRSPTGMGSRDADDLTDEELADLLKY